MRLPSQFAQKVRGVVDAYSDMLSDLDREKAAMARLWKKREAQLNRITLNMMGMCGELQGIAENAFPQLDAIGLLPEEEETEDIPDNNGVADLIKEFSPLLEQIEKESQEIGDGYAANGAKADNRYHGVTMSAQYAGENVRY